MKQGNHRAITNAERETWNRAATTYLDSAGQLTKHALPWLLDACRIDRGTHAIDIACGPGHVTNRMAGRGAKAVGVDLSKEMVDVARRLYPALTFHEADVEALPFANDTFDVALTNFSIHHFARPEMACAEIRRALKTGGRFVFAGPIEQHGFGAFMEAVSEHHSLDDLPHGPIFLDADQSVYERLMRDSGFEEFDVEVRRLSLNLDSLEPLHVAGSEICDLGRLPTETQEKIRATTEERAEPYRTASGYDFPDLIVTGLAVKR